MSIDHSGQRQRHAATPGHNNAPYHATSQASGAGLRRSDGRRGERLRSGRDARPSGYHPYSDPAVWSVPDDVRKRDEGLQAAARPARSVPDRDAPETVVGRPRGNRRRLGAVLQVSCRSGSALRESGA